MGKAIQTPDDARQLAAWNAWKDVCWVHGLGKLRGTEPVAGTPEDEEFLSRVIAGSFRRKLAPYATNPVFRPAFSDVDWAQVFDDAICEYEHKDRYKKGRFGDPENLRKKKAWKDCIWKATAESADPPLKVILGKLLGYRGIINDITEDWLLSAFPCHFDDNDMLVVDTTLDKPQSGTAEGGCTFDGEEFSKTFPGYGEAPSDEKGEKDAPPDIVGIDVPDAWKAELAEAFPASLCCLMVAHIHGVKVYKDTEVLAALGIGRTKAWEELKQLSENAEERLGGLDSELADWLLNDVAGTRFFKKWLEERCRAEKAGRLVLSRVEDLERSTD